MVIMCAGGTNHIVPVYSRMYQNLDVIAKLPIVRQCSEITAHSFYGEVKSAYTYFNCMMHCGPVDR